jgi:hypothetical protein
MKKCKVLQLGLQLGQTLVIQGIYMVLNANEQVAQVTPIAIDMYTIPYITLHMVFWMQLRYN